MYAHGKLLLTGEYFVLDGALALAAPVRFGQSLTLDARTDNSPFEMRWQSRDEKGELWFESAWKIEDDQPILCSTNDQSIADRLQQLLSAIRGQNQSGLYQLFGADIHTQVDFPRDWGLGTSSTLVSLLAQLTEVDPYQLLTDTFGGSGYDIACATADGPILYQRTAEGVEVTDVAWKPTYRQHVFFVYLGQKQNSREGIRHYRELGGTQPTLIDQVSELTQAFLEATSLEEAQRIVQTHEAFISQVLQMEMVKDQRFSDFPGVVKSLGAWGGDFVMVLSDWPEKRVRAYFTERGCPVVFGFKEMLRLDR